MQEKCTIGVTPPPLPQLVILSIAKNLKGMRAITAVHPTAVISLRSFVASLLRMTKSVKDTVPVGTVVPDGPLLRPTPHSP